MKEHNLFSAFAARLFAYLVTPLMIASIGWLASSWANVITEKTSGSVAYAFYGLLLLLALFMFTMMLVSNHYEKLPASEMKGGISNLYLRKVAMFFVVTGFMATCFSIISSLVSKQANEYIGTLVMSFALGGISLGLLFGEAFFRSGFSFQGVQSLYKLKPGKPKLAHRASLVGVGIIILIVAEFMCFSNASTWAQTIVFIGITIYLAFLFAKLARDFIRPHNRYLNELEHTEAHHLVLFLSNMKGESNVDVTKVDNCRKALIKLMCLKEYYRADKASISALQEQNDHVQSFLSQLDPYQKFVAFGGAWLSEGVVVARTRALGSHGLTQACVDMARFFQCSWEMPLRSIGFHLDQENSQLRRITFIASEGHDGSRRKFELFYKFLSGYLQLQNLAGNVELYLVDKTSGEKQPIQVKNCRLTSADGSYHGIDFGSYNEVSHILNEFLRLDDVRHIGHHNTVIDVTGGSKPVSVAGALAATVMDIKNQYVDTNGKEIKAYDFRYSDPTKIG
ncbi:hypothetical protein IC617_07545 [Neiella sp. HB171785]|uniref:Uncharacterized protein n=1 Tax=Neiella litorisoli TaxID=2771431 RepID=A0A8J6QG65_9GAMM|nr:hypothetical protein [Neiella litorisoli]MBD1389274.1 hypothetical protein [Neiella litorisoli]